MKKILLVLCAFMTISALNAEVLLKEHFDQTTEMLASNENVMANPIAETGWTNVSLSGAGIYISQTTDLTYADYKSTTDNTGSAWYKAVGKAAATPLSKTITLNGNVKSVFVAGILNVSAVGASAQSSRDYIWALGKGTSSLNNTSIDRFLRLNMRLGDSENSFQLAVSKLNEATNFQPWTGNLAYNKNYLIVTEYRYVEGEKNDSVFLYINPSKNDYGKYTLTSKQDTLQSGVTQKGSTSQIDASSFGSMMLISVSSVKPTLYIDELKVTTSWADLWESGGTPTPEEDAGTILTDETVSIGDPAYGTFSYKTYTKELEVLTEDLAQDISITHTSPILELSTLTLPKEGGIVTLTLNQPLNEGYAYDTITFTSDKATFTTIVSWYNTIVNAYSTLAALKAAYAADDEYGLYAYTGEGIVTRVIDNGTHYTYYLQDESAAILLSDEWVQASEYFEVGDKITDFFGNAGEYSSYTGVRPLIIGGEVTVMSHNNSVAPQIVTLAALQAAPANYLFEVIKLEDVSLDQKGEVFKAGSKVNITQGSYNANIQPISSSADYIGELIPAKADVVGFSTNISGTIIVPRDKKDIISKDSPTGTEDISTYKKAIKMIRDGQIIIIKEGKKFNVLGTEIK